jgi:hypothetical protein
MSISGSLTNRFVIFDFFGKNVKNTPPTVWQKTFFGNLRKNSLQRINVRAQLVVRIIVSRQMGW